MKKIVLSTISIIIMVALTATLSGCSDNGKFEGKWKADFGMAKITETIFCGDGTLKEMADCFDFSKIKSISFIFEFNSDGTYSRTPDKQSCQEYCNSLREFIKDFTVKYAEKQLADEGTEMSVDEYFAEIGTDMESFLDESMEVINVDQLTSGLESKGKYKAEDGKLYINEDVDKELSKDTYFSYEISGSEIKWTAYNGVDNEYFDSAIYPIVLVKQ